MNMDRGRREVEREKDCRTIEYFELKYKTDTQRGLSLAQVKRRRQNCGICDRTKEKKRIWLQCFRQEWRNPLFLFFLYLCLTSYVVRFQEKLQLLLFLGGVLLLGIKIKKTFRYGKTFFRQKEMYTKKAIVLREGIFKRIDADSLVRGDILRLKRGEKVLTEIVSLKEPYTTYEQGTIFEENTGRGLVTKERKSTNTEQDVKNQAKKQDIKPQSVQSTMVQELFIRQGIYFRPDFLENGIVSEERSSNDTEENRISAIAFEEMYFPLKSQIEKFSPFVRSLKESGLKMFFFTGQNREDAYLVGKKIGLVTEQRQIIDRQQFLLLQHSALERQIESIRIYCGLSAKEKRQILVLWERKLAGNSKPVEAKNEKFVESQGNIKKIRRKFEGYQSGTRKIREKFVVNQKKANEQSGEFTEKQNGINEKSGKILVMSNLGMSIREKTLEKPKKKLPKEEKWTSQETTPERNYIYACCNIETGKNDLCFKNCWREGILQYVRGEKILHLFLKKTQKTEELILGGLCIFMLTSLGLSFFIPQQGNMQWIIQTVSIFSAVYIIGKEIAQEGFRKWFLRKLNKN